MPETIYLHRARGPSWPFTYNPETGRFEHRTVKGTLYAAFIGPNNEAGEHPDVWIGRYYDDEWPSRPWWGTVEAELGATKLVFGRGEFHFTRAARRRNKENR